MMEDKISSLNWDKSKQLIRDFRNLDGKNIGIFGGSFDPFHLGHLSLAEQGLEKKDIDLVIIMPAKQNPKKESSTVFSTDERLLIVSKAISHNQNLYFSDYEIQKLSPSYSVETIEFLNKACPNSKLFWFGGLDNLVDKEGQTSSIAYWNRKSDFLKLANFITFKRAGITENFNIILHSLKEKGLTDSEIQNLKDNYIADITIPDISSTEIRDRVKNNQDLSSLAIPNIVRKLIINKKLK